jgi:hypothetical protein
MKFDAGGKLFDRSKIGIDDGIGPTMSSYHSLN